MSQKLLVFDCHEAWIHQLRALECPMDIIVGLRGRQAQGWDENMRPVPPNSNLITLQDALHAAEPYRCIIAHNLTDLLDAKALSAPRMLVLHETLDGTLLEQRSALKPAELRDALSQFVALTATHVIAISTLKGRSWGFENDIVRGSAKPSDYLPWQGDLPCGLRVSNHIARRPRVLLWNFHQQAFEGVPVTVVGHNPEMEGVKPSADWADLKRIFSHHRFFVHTADPALEDGYNLATLEAMAAGLPVLGNRNPTSPVEHGISGFLSDDPLELRGYARQLLADRELARRMGEAARSAIAENFSATGFARDFNRNIESARRLWQRRTQAAPTLRKATFPPA